jgi:uncharacterized membrane protein YsdA (DUF1294 family)/cold shock CspA family protein
MRHQGKITNWKDDQGFGFITPNSGGDKVFAHIKSFENRRRRPIGNEIVSYELKTDAKGRAQAQNIAFVGERRATPATSPERSDADLIWATVFLTFVAGSALTGKLPFAALGLYAAASFITFAAYAIDKSAARKDLWRTPESTLHFFALAGGWPGALVTQKLLRHKTKKLSFRIVFWITVALNCSFLGWLFTPTGAAMLRHALS